MADNLIDSPMKPIAEPPASNKGGPGDYNGEPGYPKRTSTPNGPPEKVRDGSVPSSVKQPDFPSTKTGKDSDVL
jgi:hypothetical protein